MAGFSSIDDKFLVAAVSKHPAVYDPNAEGYKEAAVRKKIWQSIAQQLNKHETECKTRWKALRDSYFRCKNKEKQKPGPRKTKWHLYNQLSFLNVIIGDAPEECNHIKQEPISEDSCEEMESLISRDMGCIQNDVLSKIEANAMRSSRAQFITAEQDTADIGLEQTMEEGTIDNTQNPFIDSFAEHVKSVLKCLPTKLMIQAKLEIFDTLTKYELQAASSNSL